MFEAFRCRPTRAEEQPGSNSKAHTGSTQPSAKRRRTQDTRLLGSRTGGGAASVSASTAAADANGAAASAAAQQQLGLALEKMGDSPLRLVIVGHNPSQHAWSSGHFYSNPSNWMWRILRDTGIAPAGSIRGACDDSSMPAVAGVGFTDVGSGTPGTDSSQFGPQHFSAWRPGFFSRLAAQAARASASIGCTCGSCGAPCIVAFSGKKQFAELFAEPPASSSPGSRNKHSKSAAAAGGTPAVGVSAAAAAQQLGSAAVQVPGSSSVGDGGGSITSAQPRLPVLQARRPSSIETGRQWVLPAGWPLPLTTEVWVMTSTSGAAPMTRDARYAPWLVLAECLQQEAWPRRCLPRCQEQVEGKGGNDGVGGETGGAGNRDGGDDAEGGSSACDGAGGSSSSSSSGFSSGQQQQ